MIKVIKGIYLQDGVSNKDGLLILNVCIDRGILLTSIL
jgi:hypothetical protein